MSSAQGVWNSKSDEILKRNERYLAILHSIGKNTDEAHACIQRLEHQRDIAKKNEKRYSTVLLKDLRNQRKTSSMMDSTPFSKTNNST